MFTIDNAQIVKFNNYLFVLQLIVISNRNATKQGLGKWTRGLHTTNQMLETSKFEARTHTHNNIRAAA